MSFNIGDKVRLTGEAWPQKMRGTVRIVEVDADGDAYFPADYGGDWYVVGGYTAELVESAAPAPLTREQIEAFAKVARAGDTITYRWRGAPGGSEIETTLVSDEDGDLRAASGPVFKMHGNLMATWGSVYTVTAVHHQPDPAPSAADLPVGAVVGHPSRDSDPFSGATKWTCDWWMGRFGKEFNPDEVQARLDSGEWRIISLPIKEGTDD